MLSSYVRTAVTAFAMLLMASVVFGADAYKPSADNQHQGDFSATGLATSIDRSGETFNVADKGDTFIVLADRATVQLNNGKYGTIRDLKDNARVRVVAERLSARTVLASTVTVLDDSGSYLAGAQEGFRPGDHAETSGYVMRVEQGYNEVTIRARNGSYVVSVRPSTVIRRYIYVTDISDINEGDNIELAGTVDREGKIVADRIRVFAANSEERGKYPVGKGYRPPSQTAPESARDDIIEGTVLYPVSAFDRTMGLDTLYGERKVDVPKNSDVLIDRKPGSIHEVVKGDKVRVQGEWSGTTLVASRVETTDQLALLPPAPVEPSAPTTPPPAPAVEPPPAENSAPAVEAPRPSNLTGRIIDIDYAKFELVIDAGMNDTRIDARDAAVTRKGSTRRFSELKKGDKVEVKGDWDGDVLKVVSADVVE